jgi:hypothetical protein
MKSNLISRSLVAGKIVCLGLLSLFLSIHSAAQDTKTTKLSNINLYVDAGFLIGAQASINFEKRISSGEKVTWYGRAGIGYAGVIMVGGGPGGLAAITMLTGKGKNHFEANGGIFYVYSDDLSVLPLIDVGYRFQKPQGGFIFKAKAGFLGIGIGLGYAF